MTAKKPARARAKVRAKAKEKPRTKKEPTPDVPVDLVERKALCQLLVGVTRPKSATGSRPASRDGDGDMTPDERKAFIGRVDPGDWTCEDLKKVMTVAEIKKLLLAFADLPRVAPRTTDTRNTIRSVDFVDLDDALWTVLVHGSEALSRHCENLTHLFYKFDCDKPGLSKTEFHDLWRYAAGGDAPVVLKDVVFDSDAVAGRHRDMQSRLPHMQRLRLGICPCFQQHRQQTPRVRSRSLVKRAPAIRVHHIQRAASLEASRNQLAVREAVVHHSSQLRSAEHRSAFDLAKQQLRVQAWTVALQVCLNAL